MYIDLTYRLITECRLIQRKDKIKRSRETKEGSIEYKGRGVGLGFIVVGGLVWQVRSWGHSCGLGVLHPVRRRMRVPVGVRGHQRVYLMVSLRPYQTCRSTHLRQRPVVFSICLSGPPSSDRANLMVHFPDISRTSQMTHHVSLRAGTSLERLILTQC